MRIGVLTFHRCINYGSYWQARCLVEGLRRRGHDAVLLDHRSRRIDRAEWRCALRPDPAARRDRRRGDYAAKTRRFFAAFDRLPLSRPFPIDDPGAAGPHDLVLVGSDEVWNLWHPWYGGTRLFYGDGLSAGRLAAYAASFGNQSATAPLEPMWSEWLERFDAISVRDANSRALVADAIGRPPALVLDPCLQFADCVPTEPAAAGAAFAVVYGHGFPGWLQTAVRNWAERRNVRLVSLGYDNPWADEQQIAAGPLDFAAMMAGASAIITNFFHGCVFALLNDKPFVTAPSDYRFNKVRDLVALLGAERHMVDETAGADDYDEVLGASLAAGVGARIAALRLRSDDYLDHVLH